LILSVVDVKTAPLACNARPYGAAFSICTRDRFCCEHRHTVGATIGRPPVFKRNKSLSGFVKFASQVKYGFAM
ncbi:MAG: hypothetical protein PUB32_08375, partial [Clostridiales bacterium]|nr:hypothetical protein [Clostridiales bacterium]